MAVIKLGPEMSPGARRARFQAIPTGGCSTIIRRIRKHVWSLAAKPIFHLQDFISIISPFWRIYELNDRNSNKEIAKLLKISDQTVKNHITSILKKLSVNDRTAAVVHALRYHWIKLDL